MELKRLWVSTLTRDESNARTDSPVTLSITQDGQTKFSEKLASRRNDRERGQADLYDFDVAGRSIVPEQLADDSIRIDIQGNDAWGPEQILLWGERPASVGIDVVPLALELGITVSLSTASSEGPSRLPLRRVSAGNPGTPIERAYLITRTRLDPNEETGVVIGGAPGAGTNAALELQVVSDGRLALLSEIQETAQADLESDAANVYSAPAFAAFTKASLDDRSITVRLKGSDDWVPKSLFLFGVYRRRGRPGFVVPLVYMPDWPKSLRFPFDPTNGTRELDLPLVVSPPSFPLGEQIFLAKLEDVAEQQRRILALIEMVASRVQ